MFYEDHKQLTLKSLWKSYLLRPNQEAPTKKEKSPFSLDPKKYQGFARMLNFNTEEQKAAFEARAEKLIDWYEPRDFPELAMLDTMAAAKWQVAQADRRKAQYEFAEPNPDPTRRLRAIKCAERRAKEALKRLRAYRSTAHIN